MTILKKISSLCKIRKCNIESILDKNKEFNKLIDELTFENYNLSKKYNFLINTIRNKDLNLYEIIDLTSEFTLINKDTYFTKHEISLSDNCDELKEKISETIDYINKYNTLICILKKVKLMYKNNYSFLMLKSPLVKLYFNDNKMPILFISTIDEENKSIKIDGFLDYSYPYIDVVLRCSLKKCNKYYDDVEYINSYALSINMLEIKKEKHRNCGYATLTLSYLKSLLPFINDTFSRHFLEYDKNYKCVICEINTIFPSSVLVSRDDLCEFFRKSKFDIGSDNNFYKKCPIK